MRNIIKDKKGQAESIIYFFGIIVGLFIFAIVLLYMSQNVLTKLGPNLGNVSVQAGANVNYLNTSFTGLWDGLIIFFFLFNVLILFVSAFLVDIHPMFVIIYIIALIGLFLFGMPIMNAVESIWTSSAYSSTASSMLMTEWMMQNFGIVLLGIAILSGIIMYAKIKLGGQNAGQY
jgi:hypothetical protein